MGERKNEEKTNKKNEFGWNFNYILKYKPLSCLKRKIIMKKLTDWLKLRSHKSPKTICSFTFK